MAPYTPLDLSEEQRKAVEGNLGNLDQINLLLNRLMPGFTDNLAQQGQNISDWSRGELSDATVGEISRSSAFQNLQNMGYGSAGGAFGLSNKARHLGLASEAQQQKAANAMQQWTQTAQQTYSPYLTNTAQQAGVTAANNAGQQATDQYRFNVEAGADPGAAGVFNTQVAANQQMQSSLQQAGGAFAQAYGQQYGGQRYGTTPTANYGGQATAYPTSWTYQYGVGWVPRAQPVGG